VGYAGGKTINPSYDDIGDHSETIQIDYDPTKISYGELLDIFWDTHSPTSPSWSRQYMSIIFYHNDAQKRAALASRDREEARLNRKVYTEIVPAEDFYLAEDYHQKYYLQQVPELRKEIQTIYPALNDFINSTAAARINGYVSGYGFLDVLQEQVGSLGLSPAGEKKLLEIFGSLEKMGLAQCPVPQR
jgi:peptide-methionine (S)-S-oxide reductase